MRDPVIRKDDIDMTEKPGNIAEDTEVKDSITEHLNHKKILIWGYGREGKSTERFLARNCPDSRVDIFEGKKEEIREEEYDYIIKSPGIVMLENDPKYISQTEIFLKAYRDQVIGITGTKGKSTTSAMIYHALRHLSDRKVIFLGNIGEPCLDHYEEITKDTVVVFEMSCHQLANVDVSPHIALFLNLFEEHLDYYGTVERYFGAKANITKFQNASDLFYAGDNVPPICTAAKTKVIRRDVVRNYDLPIYGEHNLYNAEFVITIIRDSFGFSEEEILKALQDFKGLPHRLEYIGEKDGIAFYDDSISTIPQAAIQAALSLPRVKTILIGGMDRGVDYDVLEKFIREHVEYNYIFSYESGRRIYEAVGEGKGRFFAEDLEAAVRLAKQITPAGSACVLSPAAASYGYFKNFEHRGDMFRQYVGI